MIINILEQPITQVDSQAAVLYLYSDMRPPKGAAGMADWYMNGFISKLMKQGKISGRLNEVALLATQGRIAAPKALILGMGATVEMRVDMISAVWKQALLTMCNTDIYQFVTSIPFVKEWNWGAGETVKNMMQGVMLGIKEAGRNIREFSLSITNFADLTTKENKDQVCRCLKSIEHVSLLGY
jgi:hypothetical protein